MSASFEVADKEWIKSILKQGQINAVEASFIMSAFDEQTDSDVTVIDKKIRQEKFLRKVCFCRLFTYVPEVFIIFLLLGYNKAKQHTLITSLYLKYFRKKISFMDFQLQLQKSVVKGALV